MTTRAPAPTARLTQATAESQPQETATCPICGAMIESVDLGNKAGWVCLAAGYAHYYEAEYRHLESWFTSGQGNLREPVIEAMTCAA